MLKKVDDLCAADFNFVSQKCENNVIVEMEDQWSSIKYKVHELSPIILINELSPNTSWIYVVYYNF